MCSYFAGHMVVQSLNSWSSVCGFQVPWESQRPRPTDAQGEQLSASVETEAETYLHHLDASLLYIPRLHDNCIRCC